MEKNYTRPFFIQLFIVNLFPFLKLTKSPASEDMTEWDADWKHIFLEIRIALRQSWELKEITGSLIYFFFKWNIKFLLKQVYIKEVQLSLWLPQIAPAEDSQSTGHHPSMNDDGPGFAWQPSQMSAEKKNKNPSEKSHACLTGNTGQALKEGLILWKYTNYI